MKSFLILLVGIVAVAGDAPQPSSNPPRLRNVSRIELYVIPNGVSVAADLIRDEQTEREWLIISSFAAGTNLHIQELTK